MKTLKRVDLLIREVADPIAQDNFYRLRLAIEEIQKGKLTHFEIVTDEDDTTDTTDEKILKRMNITPGEGTFQVLFSSEVSNSVPGSEMNFFMYANGAKLKGASKKITTSGDVTLIKQVKVSKGQAIEIRWNTSAGIATCGPRVLDLMKIG